MTLAHSDSVEVVDSSSGPVVDTVPARFSSRTAYAQTFTATIAVRVFGALSGILAARFLGPTGRGELAIIIFIPIMLLSLGEFEFSRSVIVQASKCDEVTPELTSTAFRVALALGCLEMALLALFLRFFLPADKLHLLAPARWFTFYLPASYVTASLIGIDQGRGRFGRFSLIQTMPGVLYVLMILCFLWPSRLLSPETFAFAMLAGVVSIAVLRTSQDTPAIFTTRPDWTLALRLLRRGFGFYIPSLASLALLRADMFLLVRLAPAGIIGIYAVAQAISMGQIGVINPFIQVGFAAVAQQTAEDRALETLTRHFRFAQLAAIGMGLAAAALTPWGIRVFFGVEFLSATVATYFLIAAAAFWGMGETLEQGLRAAGHPRLGIISNLIGLAILLVFGIPAYHRMGLAGLAATVSSGQAASLFVLIGFCVFLLKMRPGLFWGLGSETFQELKGAASSFLTGRESGVLGS
jgi:O-antigen/teichoic acid export membrane protein